MITHNDLDGRKASEAIKQIAVDLLEGKRIEITYRNGKDRPIQGVLIRAGERDRLLRRFKGESFKNDLLGGETEPLKYLANVNVLTTGLSMPSSRTVPFIFAPGSPSFHCGNKPSRVPEQPSKRPSCGIKAIGVRVIFAVISGIKWNCYSSLTLVVPNCGKADLPTFGRFFVNRLLGIRHQNPLNCFGVVSSTAAMPVILCLIHF